uniref:Coiled-coil domain-containing protein 25 n=1 Tax=Pundamilia nyererei TaxID=303518 RepID=A0A3B4H282_9CICH
MKVRELSFDRALTPFSTFLRCVLYLFIPVLLCCLNTGNKSLIESYHLLTRGCFMPTDEDLIKYGWPEDIWFHVDKLSSAHVYLRMPKGQTIDDIPPEVLIDCAQLVKNNSIQGCKMNNINVVYTAWANLKKTGDMDVGQIGFYRQKEVKIVAVEKKINEIINRLEKTKVERFPDLAAEKESRDREERNEKKAQLQEQKRREKEEQKRKKEQEELRKSLKLHDQLSPHQKKNRSS